jgi:hypothetical protein
MLRGMWSLWLSRNDHAHGKTPIDPGAAVEWALEEAFFQLSTTNQGSIEVSCMRHARERPGLCCVADWQCQYVMAISCDVS